MLFWQGPGAAKPVAQPQPHPQLGAIAQGAAQPVQHGLAIAHPQPHGLAQPHPHGAATAQGAAQPQGAIDWQPQLQFGRGKMMWLEQPGHGSVQGQGADPITFG